MARGLRYKNKTNGTVDVAGSGEMGLWEHESDESEEVYYRGWKDIPDEAMTRKEYAAWLEEKAEMRTPVQPHYPG